jgi:predicted nuclease of predicted toxin-antitoxin system
LSFRLYLDEHVEPQITSILRQNGWDVLTTQEAGLAGKSDEEQLEFATSQGRAVLTYDVVDYLRLSREWSAAGKVHAGIILTRRRPARVTLEGLRQIDAGLPDGIGNATRWFPRLS